MANGALSRLSESISVKLFVIGFLLLILQIPLLYVDSLISERRTLQQQAERQISQSWGGAQTIGAPLVEINYQQTNEVIDKTTGIKNSVIANKSQKITPEIFNANVDLQAEKRYLGIYELPVFSSKVKLQAVLDLANEDLVKGKDQWHLSRLFVPVGEMRGLKSIELTQVNGQAVRRAKQQGELGGLSGFWLDLSAFKQQTRLEFEVIMNLTGSHQINVLPLAGQTIVNMNSNWSDPSFNGNFLPEKREINEQGFSAQWSINELNLGIDRVLSGHAISQSFHDMNFGVGIVIPANIYQVNERSVKYGLLIMLLTFAGFFLAEMLFKLRLHPFQYLLVGVSLSVFYLLLLSLSEYLHFDVAFLMASLAVIILIAGYCMVILGNKKRGFLTGILFAVLYGFIFVLVKAEQMSLLMGAIGIWIFLAMVMYLTRKIDWYSVNNNA